MATTTRSRRSSTRRKSTPSKKGQGKKGEAPTFDRDEVLEDYRLGWESRHVSYLGRREVLTGKAKFGIFGDGKEVAQLALARAFEHGDLRAGYYRDQTVMFALGALSLQEFFAQLYAHPDPEADPASAGRQMNCHFATPFLDEDGRPLPLVERYNSAADLSPTASQMPRMVGLAHASRLYRELPDLPSEGFSDGGNEIVFGTIGNASCAEGMFWESINAVGVLGAPLLMSIWDDGYGISVPNEVQLTKGDVGALLEGFEREEGDTDDGRGGYLLRRVPGWSYPELRATYAELAAAVRADHTPALLHVTEVTQPQGHSTSGSHERYKSPERLEWEKEYDCLVQMRQWILDQKLAEEAELDAIESAAKKTVRKAQQAAWDAFRAPFDADAEDAREHLEALAGEAGAAEAAVREVLERLAKRQAPIRRDLLAAASEALVRTAGHPSPARERLVAWLRAQREAGEERYSSHLYSETDRGALRIEAVDPVYGGGNDAGDGEGDATLNGFEILNACFDQAFERHPNLFAMGEDVGRLGDVNQGMAGLQEKYGALRVSDTGIRETTILGQAIGMALRGLRPIAEIQYLDYILYALQILSDDLATLRWRTKGRQAAPVIVRTRGHRLEGVWHAGSPMAAILHLVRGMWVCVPRDMTRAAGFYNTLLASDDPGLVVEVLNGYRLKERLPENIGDFRLPLGVPEVLREGSDVTLVTYGAACRVALDAAELLEEVDIEVEVIDVQTLLPFDRPGRIVESLKKTARVVFLDEDVPGGATSYMLQQVLEVQDGYHWLDSPPVTVTAKPHRPAYGSDGDYFSKSTREDVVEAIYGLMREADPGTYPKLF